MKILLAFILMSVVIAASICMIALVFMSTSLVVLSVLNVLSGRNWVDDYYSDLIRLKFRRKRYLKGKDVPYGTKDNALNVCPSCFSHDTSTYCHTVYMCRNCQEQWIVNKGFETCKQFTKGEE